MVEPSKTLAVWLLACCALIAAMVVIGAITRLTESGLSMVEWRVFVDMLPPLTAARWQSEFLRYTTSPEYKLVNTGMDLAQFKAIYFWEWLHRLLGRLIGLAYALPLAWFWLRGQIEPALRPRLLLYLGLGGLQGFFGWYMVKSGLVHEPRVSHLRLALHLGTALLLLQLLWRTALQAGPRTEVILQQRKFYAAQRLHAHVVAVLALVCVTMVWGAFVAGLDAGLIYNEFPTMGGQFLPGEWHFLTPLWRNFIFNHATVQWTHRLLATITLLAVVTLSLRALRSGQGTAQRFGIVLAVVVIVQFALGVATLLGHVQIHLAVAHQAVAMLLLTALSTWQLWLATPTKTDRI